MNNEMNAGSTRICPKILTLSQEEPIPELKLVLRIQPRFKYLPCKLGNKGPDIAFYFIYQPFMH